MVIHDLKHPIDSLISQLSFHKVELLSLQKCIEKQEAIILDLKAQMKKYKSEVGDVQNQKP